jgi:hypothetical protein
MKVYIYTIPKAGTYFLADFIARLGFNNTGFHVNQNKFLNTAKLDMDTNARFPSRAMERQSFTRTLRLDLPGLLFRLRLSPPAPDADVGIHRLPLSPRRRAMDRTRPDPR